MKKRDTRVGCEVFEATEKWLEKKTHADAACWSQPVYTSFIWKWPYMWSAGTDLKAFHYVRMCHIFFCFLLERKGENIYYLLFLVWRMPLKRLQIQFFGYHIICFLRILSFFYFIVYSQKFFDLFFMPFLSIFFFKISLFICWFILLTSTYYLYQDNLSCRSLSFHIKYSHQKKKRNQLSFSFIVNMKEH